MMKASELPVTQKITNLNVLLYVLSTHTYTRPFDSMFCGMTIIFAGLYNLRAEKNPPEAVPTLSFSGRILELFPQILDFVF